MTQENKDLLLKNLCARLPYKIAVEDEYGDMFYLDYKDVHFEHYIDNILEGNIKPYLSPLSSMTEEQKNYIRNRFCYEWEGEPYEIWRHQIDIEDADKLIDWFNENHLDYRNLIEKDLAKDATGLNIY